MNIQNIANLTPEDAREIPMVDLAFAVLKQANNPMYYRDLMQEIAKIKGLDEEEVSRVIAQVYTEINIDGRFACVGNNLWGLKRWYPVERSEEAVGGYPRIINDDDDDDLDDHELFEDEETDDYVDGEDGYDDLDEDGDSDDGLFGDDDEIVDEDIEEEPELDEELDADLPDDEDSDPADDDDLAEDGDLEDE